ncbi:MAG: hypothetical protein ACI4U2_02490, partial [Christensenellaceae bacterium]
MKRRVIATFVAVLSFGVLAFGLTGCQEAETPHEHSYQAQVVAPTCTAQGYTKYTCECGETYRDNYVDALGHEWGEPRWSWDGFQATAEFVCAHDGAHVERVEATVSEEIVLASTCTNEGESVYTATVEFGGTTYQATKQETIEKLAHEWGEPRWSWDGFHAAAEFVCLHDESHVERVEATVSDEITLAATCTNDGERVYTATVEFGGTTYQDTKQETIEKTGHEWGEPRWSWNGYQATAEFVCLHDGAHVEYVAATVSSRVTVAGTCTTGGERTYTAIVTMDGKTYSTTKREGFAPMGHT